MIRAPLPALVLAVAFAAAGAPAPARAAAPPLPDSTLALADSLHAAIERLRAGTARRSLEPLFDQAARLKDAVLDFATDDSSPLEEFSDAEGESLQARLPGLILFYGEVTGSGAVIDAAFFADLAGEHGDDVDRELFTLLEASEASPGWPAWVRQQTDEAGCDDYDSGALPELYRDWSRFEEGHPGRYEELAEDELESITQALLDGTCACGDRASVIRGFERFLELLPGDPLADEVRARLDAIRAGTDEMRFRCTGG